MINAQKDRFVIRKFVICYSFVICALSFVIPMPVYAEEWNELKGDHFIVYYKTNESFAGQVRHKAEEYYRRIADDLGYARHSNFWQWENRVKIFIHADDNAFRSATGQPPWSKGVADYLSKQIHSYPWSEGFLDALLPHEIAHLVFRDFISFKSDVPLWLDEGVAQWEEPKKRELADRVAKYLVATGADLSLRDLIRFRLSGRSEKDVNHFYMQSVSVVDFLVRRHGARSFTEFCRALRDGKGLDEALKEAYPESIGTVERLATAWEKNALEK